jgi:hypothetical protein
MKNFPVSLVSTMGTLAVLSLGFAQLVFADENSSTPTNNSELSTRIEKERLEVQELKIRADKAWAELNLREALLKSQLQEKLSKSELEAANSQNAAKMAEAEAKRAQANADMYESQLREQKAKTTLQVLQQSNPSYVEGKVTEAKTANLETQLKLAKVQAEFNSVRAH